MITIGIDPHKSSLTAVALDPTGRQLARAGSSVNAGTCAPLMRWAARWPQRRFAVEGATAWAAASPSSSPPPASTWSTCRPPWPPAPGC